VKKSALRFSEWVEPSTFRTPCPSCSSSIEQTFQSASRNTKTPEFEIVRRVSKFYVCEIGDPCITFSNRKCSGAL
jgi:hypothetical protein